MCDSIVYVLLFKSFLYASVVCENFLVKLTFVEVHDKIRKANYVHNRPVRIKFISFQSASNKFNMSKKQLISIHI
jgi:hypothetical protein